ncbi:hypothetical protein CXB51_035201 [Gossypium anomalum]|uniref:Uncharacterized protein n=1 Tax=Gossypium anomalum TaxID=47600 RepID=A0A8J5XYN6_9ROSI|nr:hypothetical protein CXB51_035201 [Gossypium anomalum]
MVNLFHDMMHKDIEVYVDDMIAKSQTEKEHIEVLRRLFLRLRKFQLKLNPAKYTFGARSGKLLGFVVSEKGIEVDSDKVRAIQELPPLRTQKEVRGFLGRLNYIARFISQSTKKCDPIFRLLRKHSQGTWDEECQNAFEKKAIKGSAVADFLASRALEDYEPLNFDFSNEELMCIAATEDSPWKLNFDRASNTVRNGIEAVLVSPNGDHYPFTCKLDFDCTNNMAEYEACIMGLQAAIERGIKTLEVYGDFTLVIYQLRGEWETRDPKLINYRMVVLGILREFDDITFNYLPRDENQMADALATLASMIKANKEEDMIPIQMSVYEAPAHCCNIEEEEKDDNAWYQDILRYVRDRKYPKQATENDKRTLRRLACGGEAKLILEEVHEGVCGTHANGFTMARQIMRFGYYWPTMEGDCINYAKKCHKCQIYGDKIHVPPSLLHVMTSPWPFSMWGMDVIGPISPKASNEHRFIFIKEIICWYGMPERIISDNALNLNNKTITEVCDQFKIKHHNFSPYRPKMNGAMEAANKNIKKIVGKMTETYRDWHEKLPFALLAYRTSVRTSTGATPFSLVYGMEAVLPIEVEIPSL